MTVDDLPVVSHELVLATGAAVEVLTALTEVHGQLLIHEAGGTCAGSDPMCHPVREFRVGLRDVVVGEIALPSPLPPTQVWVSPERHELWHDAEIVLGVAAGRGSGFSLEAPDGIRFVAQPFAGPGIDR
ncbi:DUF779 domain-containing protein [Williamsia herbipolensis]|uniref:DUF779 domain-containing protein n=1 Tax=Williamsia herbipolensis TaxID=1603258 RepID=A0AAU4JXC0_9NOCA|nr:DUF779 domain-containing protein [Williamsia herbipolensis]